MADSPKPGPPNPDSSLKGRRILVTRPVVGSSDDLQKLLEGAGAQVVSHPVIGIRPPSDWSEVDDAISSLSKYGWIVFVSVNGVRHFLGRCDELGIYPHEFSFLKFAGIGEKTANALASAGLEVSLVPQTSDSHGISSELITRVDSERVLVVRADRGSDVLSTQLYHAGVEFRQIVVYQSFDVEVADRRVLGDLTMGDFDWVTVTSSAIARATVKLFGQHLEQTKLVSISPATSGQLETLGFSPAAEAKQYNMRGVFQSIVNFESSGN